MNIYPDPDHDYEDGEAIGSCESCGEDIYASGYSEEYCDQCAWLIQQWDTSEDIDAQEG